MPVGRIFAAVVLALGIGVPFAAADQIMITSGSALVGPGVGGSGSISLTGTDGFSLAAFLGGDASLGPKACSPCPAGTAISLAGIFSGGDLTTSRVTLDGTTYTDVNGMLSPGSVYLTFAGGPIVAPVPNVGQVVLTAPFTLDGHFSLALTENGPRNSGQFLGAGLASLTLIRDAGLPTVWDYAGVRYDFANSASVVTPEPASLLLLGTGLVIAARRLRRKQKP